MKIPKILLTIALVFSSFFQLAASIRTLDFQQKPHIGHFSEFLPDAHPVTVVYLLETQQGTQLVWCTMHIDPTDNMVNGFAGGLSYAGGMERYIGYLIENYGLDSFGNQPMNGFLAIIKKLWEKDKTRKETPDVWASVIHAEFQAGIPGGNFYSSYKYILTRKVGVIDIQHFMTGIKEGYKGTTPLQHTINRSRQEIRTGGASVEDLPSDYVGAVIGAKLKKAKLGKCPLDVFMKHLRPHMMAWKPIVTQKQEDTFMEFVTPSWTMITGIGAFVHNGWKPKVKKYANLLFYKSNNSNHFEILTNKKVFDAKRGINVLKRVVDKNPDGTFKHASIADLIKGAGL